MNVQRASVIILVVFACVYIVFGGVGLARHSRESAPDPSSSPTPPAIGFDAWPFTPASMKLAGLAPVYHVAPGAAQSIVVPESSMAYRIAHFRVSGSDVSVSHVRLDDATKTADDPITAGKAGTIVVPSGAGTITLSCHGPLLCTIATD